MDTEYHSSETRRLKKEKVDYIATPVGGGDVYTDGCLQETAVQNGLLKTFDARIHYRLAVKEVGRPLESYRDPQELVWVVYCALRGTTTGLLDELHADANPS